MARMKMTPEIIKELATMNERVLESALRRAQAENPALFALLIADPLTEDENGAIPLDETDDDADNG